MANTSRARRATAIAAAAVVAGTAAATVVQPSAAFSAVALAGRTVLSTASSAPVVSSFSPSLGSLEGGTPVVVLGKNFKSIDGAEEDAVTIGGVPAARVAVITDTKMVVVTPPGQVGTADVIVTNRYGARAKVATFGYRMALSAEFDTVTARATGGEQITVAVTGGSVGATASAFNALRISATVDGVVAKVGYVDPQKLKITIPASAQAQPSRLRLVHNGHAGPDSTSTIDYYPVITAVTPGSAAVEGFDDITIGGAGFLTVDPSDPAAVTIGGKPATYVEVVSGTKILAGVPAADPGSAAVRVTTPTAASPEEGAPRIVYQGRLSIDETGNQFLRASGGAHVLRVSGGTIGENAKQFTTLGISVRMGTTKVPAAYLDPTHLKVTVPALTTDSAQLTVVNGRVTGEPITLPVVPVVTGLSAAADTTAGGRKVQVRVAGAGLDESTDFRFGAHPATCERTGSGRSLVFACTVPQASAAGPVWVSFTAGNGVRSGFTAAAAFSYTDID